MADMIDKALDARLTDRAREAWHPVSEPPTEADADDHGQVLVIDVYGAVCHAHWSHATFGFVKYWARIRDVVLLPEGGANE